MKKILVIEDNENNLYLIRFLLGKYGYLAIEARDGKTGIEKALSEKPDLIVMDIQLPDMSGLEATQKICAAQVNSKIPIVAMTSYAMVGDKEKALAAGCSGYIEKPINPETVMDELQKFL